MEFLDLARFCQTPLAVEPFDHLVVGDFLRPSHAAAVRADFPAIAHPGLVPLSEIEVGPSLAILLGELTSRTLETAFSRKFGVDLSRYALMVTLRGRCRRTDGRIHTDSVDKVLTALLYLNDAWAEAEGRLRFLRGPDDIDDVACEVAPECGTLVAFRRSERSYHGHKPFVGERRYIMMNWLRNRAAVERELMRHRLSARVHRISGALFGGAHDEARQ
jgi:hypothetical protein